MAATDLLTLEQAQDAVRVNRSNTVHAGRLTTLVTAVSVAIDELVGPVVKRTITGETHRSGCSAVWLRYTPVASITTVKVWQQGVGTTLAAETLASSGGYLAEMHPDDPALLSGVLLRRSGWSSILWEQGTVEVTYVAGRYDNTAAVAGTRWQQAAVLALSNAWQGIVDTVASVGEYEQPVSAFPAVVLPRSVRDLLADQIQYRGLA